MAFHRQDQMQTIVVNTQAEALRFMQDIDAVSVPGSGTFKSAAHPSGRPRRKKKKKKKKKTSS